MRLSLNVLFDELSYLEPEKFNTKEANKMIFMGFQLLEDGIPYLENHLSLVEPLFKSALPENISGLIFIGNPTIPIPNDNTYLVFKKNISIASLISHIQKVFTKYNLWEESIYDTLNNNGTIQDICHISKDIFNNPLIVYDNNLLVLALENEMPGLPEWDYDQISKKLTLPLDILNDFKIDQEFQDTMSTKGTHLYAKHILGCRGLYNNLWIDGVYAGRVCIHELGRDILQKDYILLEYLTNIIASVLQKNETYKSKKIKLLEQTFKDVIEGNKVNELFFIEKLSEIGWSKDDSNISIQIMLEERDSKTSSIKYTCNKLENNFTNSLVFPYGDSILMILNLTKTRKSITNLMSELKIFLREGLFRAGISMINNDFFRLRESYMQTTLAVKVGEKIDPMYWYFHFSDYVIQAMFYETSKNISADMYCHPGLFELIKYDKKNETGLFDTLFIFLNSNMNLAHTSEKLYIHRSTLIYRLERINSLINSDLKDPDERFKLLMSFHLLEWNNINAKK